MINDFLRDEIPVYWTAKNINVEVKMINSSSNSINKLFEKGSFIIPFTGDLIEDNKIISTVYDYNQTCEIEINNDFSIPIYILLDQISLEAYPLNIVKIAQTYSRITCGDFLFLRLTNKCGFLNYDIIKDDEIFDNLKIKNYNILYHPGGIFDIPHLLTHMIYEDIFYKKSNGIRSFVRDGGGYIGSCGGLTKASAGGKLGPLPIPLYYKKRVNNPNLNSIGVSAIADILIQMSPKLDNPVKIKIKKSTSPVTYGLNDFVWDKWLGGAQVYKYGEKVEVIGEYNNTGTIMDETPTYLSTKFGKGKVVVYSTHPEISGVPFGAYNESMLNDGKIIISNSLYYTTADGKITFSCIFSKNLANIYIVFEKTADLTNNSSSNDSILVPIREKIEKTKENINNLKVNFSESISTIKNIAGKYNLDLSDSKYKYFLGIDYLRDVRFYYLYDFIYYLNESFKVFDKIELVHDLLKNDNKYIEDLDILSIEILNIINETNIILKEIQERVDSLNKDLLKYKKKIFRSRFKEDNLKLKANGIYVNSYRGFSQVPQLYFNSLKFLRTNWYNYESKQIL